MSLHERIAEQIKKCEEAGRKPRLILLHPKIYIVLTMEFYSYGINTKQLTEIRTIFGVPFAVTPYVKDFYIVDDKAGCEQTW